MSNVIAFRDPLADLLQGEELEAARRFALTYQTLGPRCKEVVARIVLAGQSDTLLGRDGVGTLLAKLQAEGVRLYGDEWSERVTEGLDALYPLN